MRVLVIGPSDTKSKGGMATVIAGMRSSPYINADIDIFPSFIDGNIVVRLLYSVYAYLRFCLIYKKYDFFHVHVASKGSTFRKMRYLKLIKKSGKKGIVHIHGAKYVEFYNSLDNRRKAQVREFLNSADTVIALSDEWKKTFEELFGIENCEAVPNGIDTDEFKESTTDPVQTGNTFVSLGRLGERKGTYDILKAAENAILKNPQIKIYLAGDGECDKVRTIIAEKNLDQHIKVVGWVDMKGKKELLKKSSTLLLPSYNEGLPMAILESMAAGKAIISTYVGAIPEVIQKENGILIKPGDIPALTDALVALSSNPQMLKEMGENNARKCEESFSLKCMHNRLNEIYEKTFNDNHDKKST